VTALAISHWAAQQDCGLWHVLALLGCETPQTCFWAFLDADQSIWAKFPLRLQALGERGNNGDPRGKASRS
jgi:hypothetical protein